MARYRRKPIVVDAVLFTGENWAEILEFARGEVASPIVPDPDSHALLIRTASGTTLRCSAGDWLVRRGAGEYRPVKPDVFAQAYEACGD